MNYIKDLENILAALEVNPELRYVEDSMGRKITKKDNYNFEDYMTSYDREDLEGYDFDPDDEDEQDSYEYYLDAKRETYKHLYEYDKEGHLMMQPPSVIEYSELRKQRTSFVRNKLNLLFPSGISRLYSPFIKIPRTEAYLSMEKKKGEPISQRQCFNSINYLLDLMKADYDKVVQGINIFTKDSFLHRDYRNITIDEYLEGNFTLNNDKRILKIGNFLQSLMKKKNWLNDLYENSRTFYKIEDIYKTFNLRGQNLNDNLCICISRHPADIAAMSTGQRWTSCMTLPGYHPKTTQGGQYYTSVKGDIVAGTIVAYLIEDSEKARKLVDPKPYARLAAKPFVLYDERKNMIDMILINEGSVYSDKSLPNIVYEKFNDFFTNWLNDKQTPISQIGLYERLTDITIDDMFDRTIQRLYPDSMESSVLVFHPEKIKTEEDVKKLFSFPINDLYKIKNNFTESFLKSDIVINVVKTWSLMEFAKMCDIIPLNLYSNIINSLLDDEQQVNDILDKFFQYSYFYSSDKNNIFIKNWDVLNTKYGKKYLVNLDMSKYYMIEKVKSPKFVASLVYDKLIANKYNIKLSTSLIMYIICLEDLDDNSKLNLLKYNMNMELLASMLYYVTTKESKFNVDNIEQKNCELALKLNYTKHFFEHEYENITDIFKLSFSFINEKGKKENFLRSIYNPKLVDFILKCQKEKHKRYFNTNILGDDNYFHDDKEIFNKESFDEIDIEFESNKTFFNFSESNFYFKIDLNKSAIKYLYQIYKSKNTEMIDYVKNHSSVRDLNEKIDYIINSFYQDALNDKKNIILILEYHKRFVGNMETIIRDILPYTFFLLDKYSLYKDMLMNIKQEVLSKMDSKKIINIHEGDLNNIRSKITDINRYLNYNTEEFSNIVFD